MTPAMAVAVGQSESVKILIPTNKCNNIIAGSSDLSMTALIDDAVLKLGKVLDSLT